MYGQIEATYKAYYFNSTAAINKAVDKVFLLFISDNQHNKVWRLRFTFATVI